jgi:hypothetical protein
LQDKNNKIHTFRKNKERSQTALLNTNEHDECKIDSIESPKSSPKVIINTSFLEFQKICEETE